MTQGLETLDLSKNIVTSLKHIGMLFKDRHMFYLMTAYVQLLTLDYCKNASNFSFQLTMCRPPQAAASLEPTWFLVCSLFVFNMFAVCKGKVYFTGNKLDSLEGIQLLVCFLSVYSHASLSVLVGRK